ncbi:MAG: class I SAM-dependent methyltransferase [Acetobacteraceae bacterium]|nr:class I SAM-dependent methyltransferase [Acetobacteraceae bacterium]
MQSDAPPSLTLYLDLLKRSLTNTLFATEPEADAELEARYVADFTRHYINGAAISMLPLTRLDNIEFCVLDVIRRGVPGDLIETGVWRGGATIFMRAILKACEVSDRTVWVADSFEGLPEPDAERFPLEAKAHTGPMMTRAYRHFAAGLDDVQRNFRAYGILDRQVRFLKGWFKDTLPEAPIERLAVMRLDGDYYESTMDALVNLYDKLSVGGYAIIDDYGEDTWTYCRKAVDGFREARGITDPLIRVDSKCYYWQRTR